MATQLDVTQEIKLDHDDSASSREHKSTIANTLIRETAIHSDTEEISVYNDYTRLGLPGTTEHNKEVKKLVYEADSALMSNPEYDSVLEEAVNSFLTHAKEEEDEQHYAASPLIGRGE